MQVVGLSTSPRANGNSERLLLRALEGAASAGAKTEMLRLADYTIGPCTECNYCCRTGACIIDDDCDALVQRLRAADGFIFATPVFFSGICAQAKALIDRAQSFWAAKHILGQTRPAAENRPQAMVIATGGSRGTRQFECVKLTMKYYLDALEADYRLNLFVSQLDSVEDLEQHPSAMGEAFRLGAELASPSSRSEMPLDVKLY